MLQPASIYSSLFIDECSENNGGCHHICVNHPTGPVCKCNKGYALHEEKCYGEGGQGRCREGGDRVGVREGGEGMWVSGGEREWRGCGMGGCK